MMTLTYDHRRRAWTVNGVEVDEQTCLLWGEPAQELVRRAWSELWARHERFLESRFMETDRWA